MDKADSTNRHPAFEVASDASGNAKAHQSDSFISLLGLNLNANPRYAFCPFVFDSTTVYQPGGLACAPLVVHRSNRQTTDLTCRSNLLPPGCGASLRFSTNSSPWLRSASTRGVERCLKIPRKSVYITQDLPNFTKDRKVCLHQLNPSPAPALHHFPHIFPSICDFHIHRVSSEPLMETSRLEML